MKKFLNLLAIETSSPLLSVALKKGNGKVAQATISGFLKDAENLVPAIERLLKKKRLSIETVDAFLIGRGPGSFTGLRIGFATLKGLLAFQKKPCYGALSLDMIAASVPVKENAALVVCLDARREKLYVRFYERRGVAWQPQCRACTLSFDELAQRLPRDVMVAGDALLRYRDAFEKLAARSRRKRKIHFLPEKYWYPEAATLIRYFATFQRKDRVTPPLERLIEPRDFLPLYLRDPEAEENKRNAHACAR